MNRFVLEYSERLMQLFEATRRFQSKVLQRDSRINKFLSEAMYRAHEFNETLAKFQSLTSKSQLSRAQTVFQDLCYQAQNLVFHMEHALDQISKRLKPAFPI